MSKLLSEMNSKELGKLFPIIISEYNPQWPRLYLIEKDIIEKAVGILNIIRISHFGSTSVPNLHAKPTIDILLEVYENTDSEKLVHNLEGIGYIYSPQPNNPAPHMMFMKGYKTNGFKGQAYHVHVRYPGDWDELYFRDYLIAHPDTAQKYQQLKLRLKERFEFDRDGYTSAKGDFIKEITKKARNEFSNKYKI